MYLKNVTIDPRKLTLYLLNPEHEEGGAKANYLSQAGFFLQEPENLQQAILRLVETTEAVFDSSSDFGDYYRVTGPLYGPTGIVGAVTVWLQREGEEQYSFITLKPMKGWSS